MKRESYEDVHCGVVQVNCRCFVEVCDTLTGRAREAVGNEAVTL